MRSKSVISALTLMVLAAMVLAAAPMLLAQPAQPQVWRASNLEGMSVKNGEGDNAETLGTIEDMLVNWRDGKIVYYALGHGRTLGLGGRTFAIAPEALAVSANREFFILNGFKNGDLDNMQGFDSNSWPTAPDARLSKGAAPQPPQLNKENAKSDPKLARLNSLLGTAVRSPDNKTIGKIYDFAVRDTKQIAYAVVSHGSTLGVGGKLYAVPLDKFQLGSPTLSANQRVFILNLTSEQFDQAPGFNSNDAWPGNADNNFWSKIKHGETQ